MIYNDLGANIKMKGQPTLCLARKSEILCFHHYKDQSMCQNLNSKINYNCHKVPRFPLINLGEFPSMMGLNPNLLVLEVCQRHVHLCVTSSVRAFNSVLPRVIRSGFISSLRNHLSMCFFKSFNYVFWLVSTVQLCISIDVQLRALIKCSIECFWVFNSLCDVHCYPTVWYPLSTGLITFPLSLIN